MIFQSVSIALELLAHIVVAFVNPFDILGDEWGSFNVFQCKLTLPAMGFTNRLVFGFIQIDGICWERITVGFQVLRNRGITITLTNVDIIANLSEHTGGEQLPKARLKNPPQQKNQLVQYISRICPFVEIKLKDALRLSVQVEDSECELMMSNTAISVDSLLAGGRVKVESSSVSVQCRSAMDEQVLNVSVRSIAASAVNSSAGLSVSGSINSLSGYVPLDKRDHILLVLGQLLQKVAPKPKLSDAIVQNFQSFLEKFTDSSSVGTAAGGTDSRFLMEEEAAEIEDAGGRATGLTPATLISAKKCDVTMSVGLIRALSRRDDRGEHEILCIRGARAKFADASIPGDELAADRAAEPAPLCARKTTIELAVDGIGSNSYAYAGGGDSAESSKGSAGGPVYSCTASVVTQCLQRTEAGVEGDAMSAPSMASHRHSFHRRISLSSISQPMEINIDLEVLGQLSSLGKEVGSLLRARMRVEDRVEAYLKTCRRPRRRTDQSVSRQPCNIVDQWDVSVGDVVVNCMKSSVVASASEQVPEWSGEEQEPVLSIDVHGVNVYFKPLSQDQDEIDNNRQIGSTAFSNMLMTKVQVLRVRSKAQNMGAGRRGCVEAANLELAISTGMNAVQAAIHHVDDPGSRDQRCATLPTAEASTNEWAAWVHKLKSTGSKQSLHVSVGRLCIDITQAFLSSLGLAAGVMGRGAAGCTGQGSAVPAPYVPAVLPVRHMPVEYFSGGVETASMTSVDVGQCVIRAHWQEKNECYQAFEMHIPGCIRVERVSAGTLASSTSVSASSNVTVRRERLKGDEAHEFEIILNLLRSAGASMPVTFLSQVMYCRPVAIGSRNVCGIGVPTSSTVFQGDFLRMDIDSTSLSHAFKLMGFFGGARLRAASLLVPKRRIEQMSFGAVRVRDYASRMPVMCMDRPSATLMACLGSLSVDLGHGGRPVVALSMKDFRLSRAAYGPHFSQTACRTKSISLYELSQENALHAAFVRDIDPEALRNELELHVTSNARSQPLLEIRLRNVRVIYLQRSLMTIIAFLRDHFIAGITKSIAGGRSSWEKSSILDCRVPQVPADVPVTSFFRFAILIERAEVHLPVNGCGTDSITVLAEKLLLQKCGGKQFSMAYSMGPLLSRNLWISDFDNVARASQCQLELCDVDVLARRPDGNDSDPSAHESCLQWKVPANVSALAGVAEPVLLPGGLFLDLAIQNAVICSWCNPNAVGSNMYVDVSVEFCPITPVQDGMYSEVYESLGYQTVPAGRRNTMKVDVRSDYVDWLLAQGQYTALVQSILQNFSEPFVNVEDLFVLPIQKQVHLQEGVYGSDSMQLRLPMISTVPINIGSGAIVAIDNSPEYYDLCSRLLHETRQPGDKETDFVPVWSYHHTHRDILFEGLRAEDFETGSANIPGADTAILALQFTGLSVDFYRRHCGGGNGIDVSALSLVACGSRIVEEDEIHSQSSARSNNIPVESLIFAPKMLSQINVSLNADTDYEVYSNQLRTQARRMSVYGNRIGSLDRQERQDEDFRSDDEENESRVKPHIRYSQQGVGNLRRCVIDIEDSVAIIHMDKILEAASYFMDPISLAYERNTILTDARGKGPVDFKASLDLEVHACNSIVCLPKTSVREEMSVICLESSFDYTQAWRGFMRSGPGKVTMGVQFRVSKLFIAPVHEIREDGAESLMDPLTLDFASEFSVFSEAATLPDKLRILEEWMDLGPWISKTSKLNAPSCIRLMLLKVMSGVKSSSPMNAASRHVSPAQTAGGNAAPLLQLQFSIQDLQYVISAINQVTATMKSRIVRKPVTQRYCFMLDTFCDIQHLKLPADVVVHVNYERGWDAGDREVLLDSCDLAITLRNNTYNLKIARFDLKNLRYNYSKAVDSIHMAAGVSLSVWTFNDIADLWEPVLEPDTNLNAIGATDTTSQAQGGILDACPVVRYEIYVSPIELNIQQSSICALARKLALADTITTSSVHLPPYRVVNTTGLPIICTLSVGGIDTIECPIRVGKYLPIERRRLVEATETALRAKRVQYVDLQDKEHRLGLSFRLGNDCYQCRDPLPIDREGLFSFEMVRDRSHRAKLLDELEAQSPRRPHGNSGSFDAVQFANSDDSYRKTSSASTQSPLRKSLGDGEDASASMNLPFALVNMKVKDDGGRELSFRSMLSMRNGTNRTFRLALCRGDLRADSSLPPGGEWNVPVQLAHPRAALFLRLDDRSDWFEVVPSLHTLLLQGSWGAPTKMRAEMCACPPETQVSGYVETNWILLVKPEVSDIKNGGSKASVPVKYPTKDAPTASNTMAMDRGSSIDAGGGPMTLDDLLSMTSSASSRKMQAMPLCINLLPPLQLCNVVPQPLLYRLADREGLVTSEGTLLPGEIVNIHSLYQIFSQKLYISFRMLNYCWTKWIKLFARTNPYPASEKMIEATMASMDVIHASINFSLPPVDIVLAMREHLIRISCPVIISNKSGMPLEIGASSSASEAFVPITSTVAVDRLLDYSEAVHAAAAEDDALGALSDIADEESANGDHIGHGFDEVSGDDDEDEDEDDSQTSDGDDGFIASSTDNKNRGSQPNQSSRKVPTLSIAKAEEPPRPDSPSPRRADLRMVNLVIHMPHDHFRKIEYTAAADWTLNDVFAKIYHEFGSNLTPSDSTKFLFLSWETGRLGPRKVAHSPAAEIDIFSRSGLTSLGGTREKDLDDYNDADDDDEGEEYVRDRGSPRKLGASQKFIQAPLGSPTTSGTAAVPPSMQYGMVADCNLSAIPMTTKVGALPTQRLRVCHLAEWKIFRQAQAIISEIRQKDGLMQMFSRTKCKHRTNFMPFEGDLPFNPKKTLGFNPMLSIRVPALSGWSEGLDVFASAFGQGRDIISVKRSGGSSSFSSMSSRRSLTDEAAESIIEFGAHVERGKDFYQNVTSISFVPKYILLSKLSIDLLIRQHSVSDEGATVDFKANSTRTFHFPRLVGDKSLEIRRADGADGNADWSGELDIANLGIIYVKLRDPLTIIKVQVEAIGASFVATFSYQDDLWPPYRFDNQSAMDMRFRQLCRPRDTSNPSASGRASGIGMGARGSVLGDISTRAQELLPKAKAGGAAGGPLGGGEGMIPWDALQAGGSCAYAWDLPRSGPRKLMIELYQGRKWQSFKLNLDSIPPKGKTLVVQKSMPVLGNPLAEGYLMKREGVDDWERVYCILQGEIMYVYTDDTRTELLDLVNYSDTTAEGLEVASVFRYVGRSWDVLSSITSSIGVLGVLSNGGSGKRSTNVDLNKARLLLLRIAEDLGIFGAVIQQHNYRHSAVASRAFADISVLLQNGYSFDQLLDEVQKVKFPLSEVLDSLIRIGEVKSIESARNLCCQLIIQEIFDIVSHDNSDEESDDESTDDDVMGKSTSSDATDQIDRRDSKQSAGSRGRRSRRTAYKNNLFELVRDSRNLITFRAPTLHPELTAISNAPAEVLASPKERVALLGGVDANEENGFSVFLGASVSHFKCESEFEFLGWIHACRQSVEKAWTGFYKGNVAGEVSAQRNFTMKVRVTLRNDGPTQVLVVREDAAEQKEQGPTPKRSSTQDAATNRPKLPALEEGEDDDDDDDDDGRPADKDLTVSANESIDEVAPSATADEPDAVMECLKGDMTGESDPKDASLQQQVEYATSILLKFEYIALSVVDSEPAEIVYLRFSDAAVSIERSSVSMAVVATVEWLQLDNQLASPSCPVMLFPRRLVAGAGAGAGAEATLPGSGVSGLPGTGSPPALYFYFQQKLDTATTVKDEKKAKHAGYSGKLLYFDVATVWMAPMQLEIEEEVLVRLIRLFNAVRASVLKPPTGLGSQHRIRDDILAFSQNYTKSWGAIDAALVWAGYCQIMESGKLPYLEHVELVKKSTLIYFSLLQLHPLDFIVNMRLSPSFNVTTTEMTVVSLVSQLDGAKLCLQSLAVEHAFGSTSIVTGILVKHYRAALWKQLQKLIGGNADIAENDAGDALQAQAGGDGQPVGEADDAIAAENASLLNDLSKSSKNLATRTLANTSGVTSKITGGIGKGVSFLTLDSSFYRSRASRRLQKSQTLSEGIYTGTKELGKNIAEGVSGLVVSPYRGWEEGGGVGLGVGIAKGILGVALKPAVGVFDLASRATEGMRNNAYGGVSSDASVVSRQRIPRAFGRSGLLKVYNQREAAAQFLTEKLIGDIKENRMSVVHHRHYIRRLPDMPDTICWTNPTKIHDPDNANMPERESSKLVRDIGFEDFKSLPEAWGMQRHRSYVSLIGVDRLLLAEIVAAGGDGCEDAPPAVTAEPQPQPQPQPPEFRVVWSCPASCIEQLFCDARGDLILSVNTYVSVGGSSHPTSPVVIDRFAQDYLVFQSLLEQTVGPRIARMQPLAPSGGLVQSNLFKRYASGYKSILMSPTRHTFQLFGYVLYEYTDNSKAGAKPDGASTKDARSTSTASKSSKSVRQVDNITSAVADIFSSADAPPADAGSLGVLTHVYPLVDVALAGPFAEDSERYSISISRRDNGRMRVLKRDESGADGILCEHFKSNLTIIFPDMRAALHWRQTIEGHCVRMPYDVLPPTPLLVEQRGALSSAWKQIGALSASTHSAQAALDDDEPTSDSILGMLVLPTACGESTDMEMLKVEIAKTLVSSRN